MINYELAKQLKDAGFWEQSFLSNRDWGRSDFAWLPSTEITKQEREKLWIPSLPELIEGCGEGFTALRRHKIEGLGGAIRWGMDLTDNTIYSTPEEAVAHLYLALNPKQTPST